MPELDAVGRIGAEEEWLRSARLVDRGRHILPERDHPLLGIVPTLLVENRVRLKHGALIATTMDIGVALVVHAGIRKGCTVGRGQPIENEIPHFAIRLRHRPRTDGVFLHRGQHRGSLFRYFHGRQGTAALDDLALGVAESGVFAEIPARMEFLYHLAIEHQVARQTAVERDFLPLVIIDW